MIYLFYGDDTKNRLISYRKFIESLREIEFFHLSRNNFDKDRLDVLCAGNSLFFKQCAVIVDNLLERAETRDLILEKLDLMSKSQNYFIFSEIKLNKSILNTFEKAGSEIKIFELPKLRKEKYDNFLIANSFERGDKLQTWIHFHKATDLGVSGEEIVGVLFWKIKDMLLKKRFGKFKEEELKKFAVQLPCILPDAYKNSLDAESVLEKFLLKMN